MAVKLKVSGQLEGAGQLELVCFKQPAECKRNTLGAVGSLELVHKK